MSLISINFKEYGVQREERLDEVDQFVQEVVPAGTEYAITRHLSPDEGLYILLILTLKTCTSEEIHGWIEKIAASNADGRTIISDGRTQEVALRMKHEVRMAVFYAALVDGTMKITAGMKLEALDETLKRFSFKETNESIDLYWENWRIATDKIEVSSIEKFHSESGLFKDFPQTALG